MNPHDVLFPDDPDPLARYRREYEQQEEEIARQQRREERERQRTQQVAPAPDDYWAEVDRRIEEKFNVALDAAGTALGMERRDFRTALRKRDREIESLRREIKMLRDEVALERGLAALKTEVAEARQQQPGFEGELKALQEKVAKQQALITRLRGQTCQLEFGQKQLNVEQQKSHRELKLTAIEVTSIGGATRTVLQRLQQEGFDLGEMQSPSGLVS